MKDRDIALGYAEVHNNDMLKKRYESAYQEMSTKVNVTNVGSVIALNDNFGLNSLLKKHFGCTNYDMVVLNGTHQKYCFNVCKEDLGVDSFYVAEPANVFNLHMYDTVLIDSSNISEEEYVALLELVGDDQNLITCYHGVLALSPPDGNGNHIPDCEVDLYRIRGQRANDFIIDEFSPETQELLEKGLEDVKNGNFSEGPDTESDLGDEDEE